MANFRQLPPAMIGDIDALLENHRSKCIAIYPEAEKLRHKWEAANIALEDVVSAFVERCGMHSVAVSFDQRAGIDLLSESDGHAEGRG